MSCVDAGALSEAWATVEDSDDLDTFQPHIIHAPHKPFPIAMTSRKPHGSKFYRVSSFPMECHLMLLRFQCLVITVSPPTVDLTAGI